MRIMQRLMIIVVVGMMCVSCATTPKKVSSTPSRIYTASPDQLHRAAVAAFQKLGLEVFKEDQKGLYVEGGRRPLYLPVFGHGGETVGVFIEPQADGKARVSIDNRRTFWGRVFTVDWTDKLFQQIDRQVVK